MVGCRGAWKVEKYECLKIDGRRLRWENPSTPACPFKESTEWKAPRGSDET